MNDIQDPGSGRDSRGDNAPAALACSPLFTASRRLIAAVLLVLLMTGACSKNETGKPGAAGPRPATPIHAASATTENVPIQLPAIGAVEPLATIEVKSQVSGIITDVLFEEGQVVEEDQVLLIIDRRPFEVALQAAEANLSRSQAEHQEAVSMVARDKAQAENARKELARDTELLSRGTISQEEFDQSQANAEALEADVRADEAAVQSAAEMVRASRAAIDEAQLQLEYCTIRSPIRGKTGSLLIHKGNLARAGDTVPLVVINQTQPIYVSFTLPEGNLSEVRSSMSSGSLAVQAVIPGEEDRPVSGAVTFIDNAVDAATGTIRLKATFSNEEDRLWPGQFVDVVLDIDTIENAVVVPSEAVQVGQSGPYVYVVKPDLTVEVRGLATGDTVDGKTIVTEGLQPGETVATDGQMRLAPGATVKVLDESGGGGAEAG
ncbi:MAG: efflux RND transporter periplasmic adaptor subunit [Candidatus Hydrogenedentes bacterium]|nr:efflux RND transporter periplasmic adaptor subunit [Candidatus Hydrogenedentota bacterium]